MASGNIRDKNKHSVSEVLSSSSKRLNKDLEDSIKKSEALKLQLGIKTIKELEQESDKAVTKIVKKSGARLKEEFKLAGATLAESALKLAGKAKDALFSGVDDFIKAYDKYYSNISTRLIGTSKTYNQILGNVKSAVSGTGATSVLSVLNKLNTLIDKGIAYNVEQRAFLDDLSGKIATTFNATNTTLLQIVRLNRADSTAAYLGMESALTEFLNANFSDTNYLADNINESVSSAIYEATSQLGQVAGAEFEYVVQKWLGSFYESGVSSNTISSIAQGLGYLGSGNVSALTSNTQLSNLFIAAADKVGLNYASLLTDGIDATTTNKLLQGIYSQAVTMATSGDSVARSQYASMFGMNVSDLTAMMNMTSSDLVSISSNMYAYADMISRTESELKNVTARTTISERISNAFENVYSEVAYGIASNAAQYTSYLVANMIKGNSTINIPYLGPVDIGTTMLNGIVGMNLLGNLGSVLTALTMSKELSLSSFEGLDTYGGGFISTSTSGALSRSTGQATYIATSSSSDIAAGTVAEQKTQSASVVSDSGYDETSEKQDKLYEDVNNIKSMLTDLVNGISSLTVKEDSSLA